MRLDFDGFGAGSKVAFNAEPLFNMRIGKRGTLHSGWKFDHADYSAKGGSFRRAALSQGASPGSTFSG
jgi:hypothetical protein